MRTAVVFTVFAALSAPLAHAQAPSPAAPAPTPQAAKPAQAEKPAPASDKTPAPAAGATQATPAPQPPANAAPPAETYSYRADGRRDPFQSLIGTGSDIDVTSRRGEGPAGMALGEISVRGIMQSRGSLVAMIQGPDTKTYIVHTGDKLLDGTIKTITPQGLIVIQEVNDPLSLVKQREVRKLLRSLEDAK
jgi:Tfp pilus assembly protein PilP